MSIEIKHAIANQMCANCGHEHLFGDYNFTQLQECGIILHSTGKECSCKEFLPLTQIQQREEGDLVPMGMSVTEASTFWYVRNRISENEYMTMRVSKVYDGTSTTFRLTRRTDERES